MSLRQPKTFINTPAPVPRPPLIWQTDRDDFMCRCGWPASKHGIGGDVTDHQPERAAYGKEPMEATETYDVQVRIEDEATIYVGDEARAAMQRDARRQLLVGIEEALELHQEYDSTDLRQVNDLVWRLQRALDAAKALRALAPVPDEEPVESHAA